jgi:hypothetical protein
MISLKMYYLAGRPDCANFRQLDDCLLWAIFKLPTEEAEMLGCKETVSEHNDLFSQY